MRIYNEFLKFSYKIVLAAGKILRDGFYKEKKVSYKGEFDPVTEYDKSSEKIIVDKILSKYPSHSILTEEGSSRYNDNTFIWIIDPLDGTVNFSHKIPFFSVSLALMIDNEIVIGVIYNPILDELFYAVKNEGSFQNNKKIFVSKTDSISKSLIATGFPYERNNRINELLKPLPFLLSNYQAFRRLGSASLDLAYVARGSIDGFYEENLKPWDTAAGILLVSEAGGLVTDYKGEDYNIYKRNIVASNKIIHSNLIDLLKEVKAL